MDGVQFLKYIIIVSQIRLKRDGCKLSKKPWLAFNEKNAEILGYKF
jgi:hypothetical protein